MTTLKVFMTPQFNNPDTGEGGIRRVCEAMIKHLPAHGIEITGNLGEADLTVGHAGNITRRKGKPYIACVHGLMWRQYDWGMWAHEINGNVIAAMIQSDAITVPSEWVRRAVTRGILRRPVVIYHGIDADEWKHQKRNQGYILWNKGRADNVSDPSDMHKLASKMFDLNFVSTYGEPESNVEIIGRIPAPKMKSVIQRAGVYLATARETFGIGTLEAMAAGTPVAGWDYGGQSEIIINGETGYLAPVGDYGALADCVRRCITDRKRISDNAQQDIRQRWTWESKIAQYAGLFKATYDRICGDVSARRVSVIVTCHNLGRYLPDALRSVLGQSYKDWECIIVDDQSTDNTQQVASEFCRKDRRFRYYKTPSNLKLCGALNFGFEHSTGRYVVNLDADNILPPDALRIQVEEFESDATIHIASGDLDLINEDASQKKEKIWHNKADFDFRAQMAHINQIHSSSMVKREVREELGGYRERYWRAEDAHFWCVATSFGYRAKIVTTESTLEYRMRSDSKSMQEANENSDRDGDWTIDFPWRIAGNPSDGARLLQDSRGLPNAYIVPFGAQAMPTINNGFAWNCFHQEQPLVSVVIPVGPGHKRYVIDALDSLIAQDFYDWEAVVINDSGEDWTEIAGAPYANVFRNTGKHHPSVARNLGLAKARGKIILFLDADDYLMPGVTLRKMVERYAKGDGGYVYTDNVKLSPDGKTGVIDKRSEYSQEEWKAQSSVTVLIAKADVMRFGGFDEDIEGWEEWDLFLKMQVGGICGVYLPIPGFFYRFHTGMQREKSAAIGKDRIYPMMRQRYQAYFDGVKEMGNCCGGNGDAVLEAKATLDRIYRMNEGIAGVSRIVEQQKFEQTSGITPVFVRMEFIGPYTGAVTYFGRDGRQYRGGDNHSDKYADVHPVDVGKLENTGHWKVIKVEPQKPEPIIIDPQLEIIPANMPVLITDISTEQEWQQHEPMVNPIEVTVQETQETVVTEKRKKRTHKERARKVKAAKNGKH